MKVVQVLTQSTGGPCDHAADVAVELVRCGHEAVLVAPDGPAVRRARNAGVHLHMAGPRSTRDLAGARDLVALLRAQAPDVVHLQDRRAGLVGRLASRWLRGARTVYTLHGIPDSMSFLVAGNLQVDPPRRRDRLTYLRAEQALRGWSGSPVVVPSAALQAYAVDHLRLPPAAVHVVPNGVDLARFSPGLRRRTAGRLDVVFLGALVPTKRVDVLLAAAARVPGVHVDVVGLGELEPALRALVDRLGIAERVRWSGWSDDPAGLLAVADVLALPSAAENLPLAVLQAMACGAAVVASRVGGLPELIGADEGVLVPPGDVDALAAVLARLRDDPAERDALGAAARRRVETGFSVTATTARLLEVYACES